MRELFHQLSSKTIFPERAIAPDPTKSLILLLELIFKNLAGLCRIATLAISLKELQGGNMWAFLLYLPHSIKQMSTTPI